MRRSAMKSCRSSRSRSATPSLASASAPKAKGQSSNEIWELHVQLPHPAFFRKARETQLETMRRLDEALHRQLQALGAQDLRWFVQDKRDDACQVEP